MRAILGLLVVLSAGCAPVAPPGGRSEGSVTWTIGGTPRTVEIAGGCWEQPGGFVAVSAGTRDGGITVQVFGPTSELDVLASGRESGQPDRHHEDGIAHGHT